MEQRVETSAHIEDQVTATGDASDHTRRAHYATGRVTAPRAQVDVSKITVRPPALPARQVHSSAQLHTNTMEVDLDELYSDDEISFAQEEPTRVAEELYLVSGTMNLDIADLENPTLVPVVPQLPEKSEVRAKRPSEPPALPFVLKRKRFAAAPPAAPDFDPTKTITPEEAFLASLPASARAVLERARDVKPSWPHAARIRGAVARPR